MAELHIFITGHRPKDLSDAQLKSLPELAHDMVKRAKARHSGPLVFHCGGALGVDQIVHHTLNQYFEMVDNLMGTVLHSPGGVDKQGASWTPEQRSDLMWIRAMSTTWCRQCEALPLTQESYAHDMQARNIHMADQSKMGIAFWTGKTKGGTYNTIRYALSQGKPVYNALNGFNPIKL